MGKKESSGTVSGPCCVVRTTHTGNSAPTVLKRNTLLADQPLPAQGGRLKYGVPVFGLFGAQFVLVLPVAITPTFSPITLSWALPEMHRPTLSERASVGHDDGVRHIVEGCGSGRPHGFVRPSTVPRCLVENRRHACEAVTGYQGARHIAAKRVFVSRPG